jgi:hypothetical protein
MRRATVVTPCLGDTHDVPRAAGPGCRRAASRRRRSPYASRRRLSRAPPNDGSGRARRRPRCPRTRAPKTHGRSHQARGRSAVTGRPCRQAGRRSGTMEGANGFLRALVGTLYLEAGGWSMTLHNTGYVLEAGVSLENLDMGGGSVLALRVTGAESDGRVTVIEGVGHVSHRKDDLGHDPGAGVRRCHSRPLASCLPSASLRVALPSGRGDHPGCRVGVVATGALGPPRHASVPTDPSFARVMSPLAGWLVFGPAHWWRQQ